MEPTINTDNSFEEYKAEIDAETLRLKTLFGQFKQEFPNLYSEMTEYYMFDVPKGWVGLVRAISRLLETTDVKCVQVKQKFGTLRYNLSFDSNDNKIIKLWGIWGLPKTAREAIANYEIVSESLCEECGSWEGRLNQDWSFIRTLCPNCAETRTR